MSAVWLRGVDAVAGLALTSRVLGDDGCATLDFELALASRMFPARRKQLGVRTNELGDCSSIPRLFLMSVGAGVVVPVRASQRSPVLTVSDG